MHSWALRLADLASYRLRQAALLADGYSAICGIACVAAWLRHYGSSLEVHDGQCLHKGRCVMAFEAPCTLIPKTMAARQRLGMVERAQRAGCLPVIV
ncbi:hypothetical protein WJX72_000763 [[Myrmecia] bisecta]|uniref:Uncharacterized protein n=1 Tax=[Myrmecia] bisecta TaxID=41462 RepID=A0AAW1PS27_9CHLO